MNNDFVILIPARIGSTRLPNKPLTDLSGKSLIQRVFEQATKSTDNSYIATDSELIMSHAESFTDNIVMTSQDHISGTDRVAEAASILSIKDDQLIINLQGDEPFMPINLIDLLADDFKKNKCDVITACHPISSDLELKNPNCVKVNKNSLNFADDFIREIDHKNIEKLLRHIGIYGYSHRTLKELVALKPSHRELKHKLEQLRFLDNNYSIFVSDYDESIPPGIDTQEDVDSALLYIKKNDC
tara:strand:+ start:60 stop:788 length:729 start_codon:yes stop_codon:yes gene_type:complete